MELWIKVSKPMILSFSNEKLEEGCKVDQEEIIDQGFQDVCLFQGVPLFAENIPSEEYKKGGIDRSHCFAG